ncbi:hypothetical protein [Simiduia aestuariiviva]|uniref:Uncharacterized protein n=1 Tax=Simiduia aestuariiviva TaxID=1510459 RepID=A0A839UFS2_9GAMM|nr:hypothetical protein [Simiduia aestuariiviva]MBB3166884.1 hypothetical protein [Simiduia aestuariiviva]
MKTVIFAITLLTATGALANSYVCTHGGMERSITVVYHEPGQAVPCEVQYTKQGESQTLWRADNEGGYCEAQASAFAEKQAGWGWECQQASAEPQAPIEPAEGADGQ